MISVLANMGKGNSQRAPELGISTLTVWRVVKIYCGWGFISDVKRPGRLFKIISEVKQLVEKAVQENPHTFLNDITEEFRV